MHPVPCCVHPEDRPAPTRHASEVNELSPLRSGRADYVKKEKKDAPPCVMNCVIYREGKNIWSFVIGHSLPAQWLSGPLAHTACKMRNTFT